MYTLTGPLAGIPFPVDGSLLFVKERFGVHNLTSFRFVLVVFASFGFKTLATLGLFELSWPRSIVIAFEWFRSTPT